MNINKAMILGNVSQDPQIRRTQSGQTVASFSVATNKTWVADGEKKTDTTFHNCTAWRKTAEIVEKHVYKGQKVYIEGEIKNSSYEQNGVTKYKSEIVVSNIIMLSWREENTNQNTNLENNQDISIDDIPL